MKKNAPTPQIPGPAERIKRLRGRLGLTQEALAAEIGVSFATVNRWENNQTKPSRHVLANITELEKQLIAEASTKDAEPERGPIHLDFTANAEIVRAITEGERLEFGHTANPAFATEISKIDPLPHQRIAVYQKMLPQDRLRYLLADDAGAGKTIMTGLQAREMLSRRIIKRILIVPPAGLVGNWQSEMQKLFSLNFKVVSGADANKGNPFAGEDSDLVIVSVDTLRGPRLFKWLGDETTLPYDLVVFDEAHKLSARQEPDYRIVKTDRYQLAEALAGVPDRSDKWKLHWSATHLLLLTATPHMGNDYPYYALWRLLHPTQLTTIEAFNSFPREERESHFIRRTKEEMVKLDGTPLYPVRNSDTLGFELTQGDISEQALYDKTTDYLKHVYNKAKMLNRSAARLAMSVFQRRLASSTYSLLRSFERRHEKLSAIVDQVKQGNVTVDEATRTRLTDDDDIFECKTADEESEGDEEENEASESKLLGYFVAASLRDLEAELTEVKALLKLAKAVHDRGLESKFEKLQEILALSEYENEKLIIFTEHKDTLIFLIRRLEGLGYTGKVAQIHGGMHYKERALEVEKFRKDHNDGGARFMVCTDAAAEGINLQFCWIMINYDIPWNPARLEQRMGRIHRYGQKHDPVVIMNLVAPKTREGRVLKTLLDKLEKIRKQLDSDKVFDAIGRVFEGVSIRDYMSRIADTGDIDSVENELEGKLTKEQVEALLAKEAKLYGGGGDVKPHLPELQAAMNRETYFKLLPGYVRSYFEKAAPTAGVRLHDLGKSRFHIQPTQGKPSRIFDELEKAGVEASTRFTFLKPEPAEINEVIWLHPGEPMFETFRESFLTQFRKEAQKGAVFIDPEAEKPYLFHLARVTILRKADPQIEELKHPETIDCRLVGLKQYEGSEIEVCPLEHLLLLRGTHGIPSGSQLLASEAGGLREEARAYLMERNAREMAVVERKRLESTLEDRISKVERGFAYQAAELAKARAKHSKKAREGNRSAEIELERIKRLQRTQGDRLEQTLKVLRREPNLIQAAPIEFISHALVVPSTDPKDLERHEADVEQVAMNLAWAFEESSGAVVKDVHTPALARAAGLGDNPGFDLWAVYPDGEERCIEVKGRGRSGDVEISVNEWSKACNLREKYWLYVVYDCATPAPRMSRVQDPFLNILAKAKGSFLIAPKSVLEAAEKEEI